MLHNLKNIYSGKKKTLAGLMGSFVTLALDLRELARDKADEARRLNDAANALRDEATKQDGMADYNLAEAEEALAAADRIEELVGSSVILEAAAEKL